MENYRDKYLKYKHKYRYLLLGGNCEQDEAIKYRVETVPLNESKRWEHLPILVRLLLQLLIDYEFILRNFDVEPKVHHTTLHPLGMFEYTNESTLPLISLEQCQKLIGEIEFLYEHIADSKGYQIEYCENAKRLTTYLDAIFDARNYSIDTLINAVLFNSYPSFAFPRTLYLIDDGSHIIGHVYTIDVGNEEIELIGIQTSLKMQFDKMCKRHDAEGLSATLVNCIIKSNSENVTYFASAWPVMASILVKRFDFVSIYGRSWDKKDAGVYISFKLDGRVFKMKFSSVYFLYLIINSKYHGHIRQLQDTSYMHTFGNRKKDMLNVDIIREIMIHREINVLEIEETP